MNKEIEQKVLGTEWLDEREKKIICPTYDGLVRTLADAMRIDQKKLGSEPDKGFDHEDIISWIGLVDFKDGKRPNVLANLSSDQGKKVIKIDVQNQKEIESIDEKITKEEQIYSWALIEAKMKVVAEIAEEVYPAVAFQINDLRKEMAKGREEILGNTDEKVSLRDVLEKLESRKGYRKLMNVAVITGIVLSACQAPATPTEEVIPRGTQWGVPTATETATITPSETVTVEPTATATPEAVPTQVGEVVHVEELNPDLWWMVVRDQVDVGTYKRVMQGEYKLVRDDIGRIIEAYDSKGEKVDAILFPKGGYGFGWEAVVEHYGEMQISVVVPVINLGEIVESNQEINGTNYDFTSLRVLIGVEEEEFNEYLMPFTTVVHGPDGSEFVLDKFGLSIGGQKFIFPGKDKVGDVFTRGDNLYKQFTVDFSLIILMTYEQYENTYGPAQDPDYPEAWKAMYELANGMDRYSLYSQHKWPTSGEIFALAQLTYNRLEGVSP